MSLRIYARALFGVAFILLAVPAVIALAGELAADDRPASVLSGVVVEEHGDDFANDTEQKFLTLVTSRDRYTITGPGAGAVHAGQHVRVTGKMSGNTMYLAGAGSVENNTWDKLSGAESAALTSVTSTTTTAPRIKTVAVLLINFANPTPAPTPSPTPCVTPGPTTTPGPTSTSTATPTPPAVRPSDSPEPSPTITPSPTPFHCPPPPTPAPTPVPPPQPWTTQQVAGYYFNNTKSVASFYREVSNGELTITGDVYGWYTLTVSTSNCDYNNIATAARNAATKAGVDLTAYTNVAYAMAKVSSCSWGGLGNVYGPYTWINGSSAMGVYVPSHELGHNFGSHHASSLTCTNTSGVRVQFSSNCTRSEYGDPFDVMGSNASSAGGIHHLNTWARRQVGILDGADMETITATGNYYVATAQVDGGIPRILRIARPSGDYYYMESRIVYGLYEDWAATAPAVNGVMIRIAPGTTRTQSKLIDCNPETSGFSDAPCAVGEKFVDRVNDITIIPRAIDAAGASVYVQIGPDVTLPGSPGPLSAAWTGQTAVSLSWTAASDNIGVTGYQVRRDGTLITTVPGTSLTFDDMNVPANTQRYTVAARDAAGNVGPAVSASVGAPDTTPPGKPGSVQAVASAAGQANLSWTAATDDLGVVGYDVSVDGTLVGTVTGLTYTATSLTSLHNYTFAVAARDGAGNVGQAAETAFVMPDMFAPGAPGGLVVTGTTKTSVTLGWTAASDDVGVVSYDISRNGVFVTTTPLTSFSDTGLAAGTAYAFSVVPVDAAGNKGTAATVNATTVEGTPPTVGGPVLALATSGQLDTSAVPVVVSWTATDTSGLKVVEVEQSKNGGSWTAVTLPSPTATSVTLMRAPGNTFRYRVRATDTLANTSAWLSGPTVSLIARQESSTAITYAGSWTTASTTTAYGGALKYAASSTATATTTFTGRSVAWVAPRSSVRGKADVYVDGVLAATVDLYSATSQARMVVFSRSWATVGTHTLQIKVKATTGRPRVDLDAVVIAN